MGDSASVGFLAASSIIGAGTSFSSAYTQSQAIKSQAGFEKGQAEFNSHLADLNAAGAKVRGEKLYSQYNKKVKQTIGSQRAAYAAQGIDVTSGSAHEVQTDTRRVGDLDLMTIKNNAWQEAWGYKTQALQDTMRGNFTSLASDYAAKNTLLAGGLSSLSYGLQGASYLSKGPSVSDRYSTQYPLPGE